MHSQKYSLEPNHFCNQDAAVCGSVLKASLNAIFARLALPFAPTVTAEDGKRKAVLERVISSNGSDVVEASEVVQRDCLYFAFYRWKERGHNDLCALFFLRSRLATEQVSEAEKDVRNHVDLLRDIIRELCVFLTNTSKQTLPFKHNNDVIVQFVLWTLADAFASLRACNSLLTFYSVDRKVNLVELAATVLLHHCSLARKERPINRNLMEVCFWAISNLVHVIPSKAKLCPKLCLEISLSLKALQKAKVQLGDIWVALLVCVDNLGHEESILAQQRVHLLKDITALAVRNFSAPGNVSAKAWGCYAKTVRGLLTHYAHEMQCLGVVIECLSTGAQLLYSEDRLQVGAGCSHSYVSLCWILSTLRELALTQHRSGDIPVGVNVPSLVKILVQLSLPCDALSSSAVIVMTTVWRVILTYLRFPSFKEELEAVGFPMICAILSWWAIQQTDQIPYSALIDGMWSAFGPLSSDSDNVPDMYKRGGILFDLSWSDGPLHAPTFFRDGVCETMLAPATRAYRDARKGLNFPSVVDATLKGASFMPLVNECIRASLPYQAMALGHLELPALFSIWLEDALAGYVHHSDPLLGVPDGYQVRIPIKSPSVPAILGTLPVLRLTRELLGVSLDSQAALDTLHAALGCFTIPVGCRLLFHCTDLRHFESVSGEIERRTWRGDFGGDSWWSFYMGTDPMACVQDVRSRLGQAIRGSTAVLLVYAIPEEVFERFNILSLDSADERWQKIVYHSRDYIQRSPYFEILSPVSRLRREATVRFEKLYGGEYDAVCGPVAQMSTDNTSWNKIEREGTGLQIAVRTETLCREIEKHHVGSIFFDYRFTGTSCDDTVASQPLWSATELCSYLPLPLSLSGLNEQELRGRICDIAGVQSQFDFQLVRQGVVTFVLFRATQYQTLFQVGHAVQNLASLTEHTGQRAGI